MSKKKDVLVILHRKKRMSFNLFDKNCTQENVQLHLQHGESWLGGIVIEQVNYKQPAYISWKKLCSHTFKDSLEEAIVMYSKKMKAKYMKEDL